MIHLVLRAIPIALASLLLAATTAAAQSGAPSGVRPQVQAPPRPQVPSMSHPSMPQVPSLEGLPAYEPGSPYSDVMQSPTGPEAQAMSQSPLSPGSPYHHEGDPEAYSPHLPGRIRSYLENRPRQQQLRTESWLNRPLSAGFTLGGMFLDDPIAGIEGDAGILYGGRLGWDFAPRFGLEGRIGGASPGVSSTVLNIDLPQSEIFFADVNWLWYPTGDTRWRPYFSVGTGLFDLDFKTASNHRFHDTLFSLPYGVGMKYRYSSRTVMRFEFMDNFAFGTSLLNDMHNLSFSAGLEMRFGGGFRKSYYPWKPDHNWR